MEKTKEQNIFKKMSNHLKKFLFSKDNYNIQTIIAIITIIATIILILFQLFNYAEKVGIYHFFNINLSYMLKENFSISFILFSLFKAILVVLYLVIYDSLINNKNYCIMMNYISIKQKTASFVFRTISFFLTILLYIIISSEYIINVPITFIFNLVILLFFFRKAKENVLNMINEFVVLKDKIFILFIFLTAFLVMLVFNFLIGYNKFNLINIDDSRYTSAYVYNSDYIVIDNNNEKSLLCPYKISQNNKIEIDCHPFYIKDNNELKFNSIINK